MVESIIGRHFFNETQASLMASSGDPTRIEPACRAIIRAAKIHREAGSLDHMVAALSFRLSLSWKFLSSLEWTAEERWAVALGLPFGFKGFDDTVGASVPHALADLGLIVATQIDRGIKVIERDHRQMITASNGIVSGLCWEDGFVTARGRDVDEFYSSGLFELNSRQAS